MRSMRVLVIAASATAAVLVAGSRMRPTSAPPARGTVAPGWVQDPGEAPASSASLVTGSAAVLPEPVDTNGPAYVGSSGLIVYAVDGRSGASRWATSVGEMTVTPPAVGPDGTVYRASMSNVYALDAKTGAVRWTAKAGAQTFAPPAVGPEGNVYIASFDHKLCAFDGATGAPKWRFDSAGAIQEPPTVGPDGTVYIASWADLYAIDGRTGGQRWVIHSPDHRFSTPIVAQDGTLYAGASDNRLYALDPRTGAQKWSFKTEGPIALVTSTTN